MTSQQRPLTILHVTAPARVGGLERVVQALAGEQAKRGHRVHVIAVIETESSEPPFLDALRKVGVTVHALHVPARAYLRERALVRTICAQIHPHVVHTHGYRSDVVDGPVARRLGIPIVTTTHGFTGSGGKGNLYEWLQRRAIRRFDRVIAVSQPQAEQLVRSGIPRNRITVLTNAWAGDLSLLDRETARARLGAQADTPIIGWIGRLSPEKGADVMLRAFKELPSPRPQLSIIGGGAAIAELQDLAHQLGIAAHVSWHGEIDNAAVLLSGFDVFVLSSRTEGTPIVLFEAMAAAVPIVTTAVGGVPDVVSPAEAHLVPSENAVAIAAAIRDVLKNRDAAQARVAAATRKLQRSFGRAEWLDRYEELYRGVCLSC